MRFFSADHIIPVNSKPVSNGVIQVDNNGKIQRLGKKEDFPSVDIQHFSGVILPGFINTHCHLELSHMQGLCPTGTGLIAFISRVVGFRDFDQQIILDAIARHDREMYENGIQAVGDICNKPDTAKTKSSSPIHYYSFVELFDLMQSKLTNDTIKNYREVFSQQSDHAFNRKSFVPHAPYSVSSELFDFINRANPFERTISIHNQETPDESQLFELGDGGFYAFYKSLNLNIDFFRAPKCSSLSYTLKKLNPRSRNIFVHNTMTSEADIIEAHNWSSACYWATCPNANLFIENRLPNYRHFLNTSAKMCIGTDSIMSNWELSIWEELKTIKKYASYVPLEDLIRWATLNGAEALGYESLIGSLEVGKSPGLVNVDIKWQDEATFLGSSRPTRIL